MQMNIVTLEEVSLDLDIGRSFYEKQSIGLGDYFKDSILSDIESLWLYRGIHIKMYNLYRLLFKGFPYGIYYEFNYNITTIIAILDLRLNPKNITEFIKQRKKDFSGENYENR